MKFKEVLVYTGYAENGIAKVTTFDANSLAEAIQIVEDQQLKDLQEDENLCEDWYNEFFGHGRVCNGVGIVDAGEENVIVVLSEQDEWYDKVDSFEDWGDVLFKTWSEWLDSEF